jgi:hypothetical protein
VLVVGDDGLGRLGVREVCAFGFGQAAPDAVCFTDGDGVCPAFGQDGAALAYLFGAMFTLGADISGFVVAGEEQGPACASAVGL